MDPLHRLTIGAYSAILTDIAGSSIVSDIAVEDKGVVVSGAVSSTI